MMPPVFLQHIRLHANVLTMDSSLTKILDTWRLFCTCCREDNQLGKAKQVKEAIVMNMGRRKRKREEEVKDEIEGRRKRVRNFKS